MTLMVDVVDYELISLTNSGKGSLWHSFDVLLSCGHLQPFETHMPYPPNRVVCTLCMDSHQVNSEVTA